MNYSRLADMEQIVTEIIGIMRDRNHLKHKIDQRRMKNTSNHRESCHVALIPCGSLPDILPGQPTSTNRTHPNAHTRPTCIKITCLDGMMALTLSAIPSNHTDGSDASVRYIILISERYRAQRGGCHYR